MIGKHNTGGFKIPAPEAFPRLQGELNMPKFRKDDQVVIVDPEHEHCDRIAEVVSADTTEEDPGREVAYLVKFLGTEHAIWVDEKSLLIVPDQERLERKRKYEPAFKSNQVKFDPERIRKSGEDFAAAVREAFKREDRPAELKKDRIDDPMLHARKLVHTIFYERNIPLDDVYVVWFCAALQNWKALVSTNVKDNAYYEVTHNGDKNETYVDKYLKVANVSVDENINRYAI